MSAAKRYRDRDEEDLDGSGDEDNIYPWEQKCSQLISLDILFKFLAKGGRL